MKSAYELAMERLNKTAPTKTLTTAQKQEIAEIDSRYTARVAERELALKSEMEKAESKGQVEEIEMIRAQLKRDLDRLRTEMEEKKNAVRDRPA